MNETATILILTIVGVWFFTSPRFQAFHMVLTYQPPKEKPSEQNSSPYTPEEQAKIKQFEDSLPNGIIGNQAVV